MKLLPQDLALSHDLPGLARMSIDKKFYGTLEATTKGEMLGATSPAKGSAGYVATERVTGTLQGRKGSFVLQHNVPVNRGIPALSIAVVPDSGTEELFGSQGMMTIDIVDKQHFYTCDYEIAG